MRSTYHKGLLTVNLCPFCIVLSSWSYTDFALLFGSILLNPGTAVGKTLYSFTGFARLRFVIFQKYRFLGIILGKGGVDEVLLHNEGISPHLTPKTSVERRVYVLMVFLQLSQLSRLCSAVFRNQFSLLLSVSLKNRILFIIQNVHHCLYCPINCTSEGILDLPAT